MRNIHTLHPTLYNIGNNSIKLYFITCTICWQFQISRNVYKQVKMRTEMKKISGNDRKPHIHPVAPALFQNLWPTTPGHPPKPGMLRELAGSPVSRCAAPNPCRSAAVLLVRPTPGERRKGCDSPVHLCKTQWVPGPWFRPSSLPPPRFPVASRLPLAWE